MRIALQQPAQTAPAPAFLDADNGRKNKPAGQGKTYRPPHKRRAHTSVPMLPPLPAPPVAAPLAPVLPPQRDPAERSEAAPVLPLPAPAACDVDNALPLLPIVERFKETLPEQSGLASNTARGYGFWAKELSEFIGPNATLADFTLANMNRYRNMKADIGLVARSLSACNTAFRAFGLWLVQNGHADSNPALMLAKIKLSEPTRHLLQDKDSLKILAACTLFINAKKRIYARAVLSVLVHAGLRRNELLSLHLDDFQADPAAQGS